MSAENALAAVAAEVDRHVELWGVQKHPDGTGDQHYADVAQAYKAVYDHEKARLGDVNWATVLLEEVYEALSETRADKLREELVQVAAVAVSWLLDLEKRGEDAG